MQHLWFGFLPIQTDQIVDKPLLKKSEQNVNVRKIRGTNYEREGMGHPGPPYNIYTQPRIFYKNKQGTCKNAYKLLLSLYSVLISIPYHMYILPRRRSTSYYTPEIASCQVKNARNVIFFKSTIPPPFHY